VEVSSSSDAYLNEVLIHVRWKKSHGVIRKELSDHIEDAWLGFLAQGMNGDEAQEKAVLEMGDAADVGTRLDKAYRPPKNYGVWVPFAVLFLLGMLIRYIAIGSNAFSLGTLLFPVTFVVLCFFPFGRFIRFGYHVYGLYLIGFLFLTLPIEGTTRFLYYMPLVFPVVYALLIYRMRGRGLLGILLLIVFFSIQGVFHLLALPYQHTSLIMLCVICLAQLLYALFSGWFSCKKWQGALMIFAPILLFIGGYLLYDPYLFYRIKSLYAGNGMYYSTVVSDVLANAPWFGTADPAALGKDAADFLSNSVQSSFSQYFLAWLVGNFGRFAFVAVVLVFLVFFAFSLRVCLLQRSMLYRFTSLGILLYFLIESICHVLACLAIFRPLSFLPFVSGNAAAMLCNAALAGLLFSLLYNGSLMDDDVEKKYPGWRVRLVKEIG